MIGPQRRNASSLICWFRRSTGLVSESAPKLVKLTVGGPKSIGLLALVYALIEAKRTKRDPERKPNEGNNDRFDPHTASYLECETAHCAHNCKFAAAVHDRD